MSKKKFGTENKVTKGEKARVIYDLQETKGEVNQNQLPHTD